MSWSPLDHAQGTLFRLCDRCTDDLRTWVHSATFEQLWTVEPRS